MVEHCRCGCGEPAEYAAGHVNWNMRLGPKLAQWEARDMGYETPCWIWLGSFRPNSQYGRVYFNQKYRSAHRAVYEDQIGPIPDGHDLHHLCEVQACVNPSHLEPIRHGPHARLTRLKV